MYLFEATGPNCFNNVLYKTLLPLKPIVKRMFWSPKGPPKQSKQRTAILAAMEFRWSSPARIYSHSLNGTFLCLLFSCLKNWSRFNIVWQTMNKDVRPSWTKHDTAPQNFLSLTIDVVLHDKPTNPPWRQTRCRQLSFCVAVLSTRDHFIQALREGLNIPLPSQGLTDGSKPLLFTPLYSSPLAHHGVGPLHLSAVKGPEVPQYGMVFVWHGISPKGLLNPVH